MSFTIFKIQFTAARMCDGYLNPFDPKKLPEWHVGLRFNRRQYISLRFGLWPKIADGIDRR